MDPKKSSRYKRTVCDPPVYNGVHSTSTARPRKNEEDSPHAGPYHGNPVKPLATTPRKNDDPYMAPQQVGDRTPGWWQRCRPRSGGTCHTLWGFLSEQTFDFGHDILNRISNRNARSRKRFDFGFGSPHGSRNDGTCVSHALSGRGRAT